MLVLAVSALLVVLSYWPIRNLLSEHQLMNASFNRWHLVNTYGAFGSVTRTRYEVIVEGTLSDTPEDDAEWLEYQFKGKPGDVNRVPRQFAPYHLRLDWLMWFLPLRGGPERWFLVFLMRLLNADRSLLRLLRVDPFGGIRPRWVRARLFEYRFSTAAERRETGRGGYARRPVNSCRRCRCRLREKQDEAEQRDRALEQRRAPIGASGAQQHHGGGDHAGCREHRERGASLPKLGLPVQH